MITGRDFIVLADDWYGLPTSANHLFRRLARHNRVFWFNTIGRMPRMCWADGSKVLRTLGRWIGIQARSVSEGQATPSLTLRACMVANEPGVHLTTPLMIPWFKPLGRTLNRWSLLRSYQRLKAEHDIRQPIVLTTFPYNVDVVRAIPDAVRIYYCVDDFLDYPGVAHADWARMEVELLGSVDGLVVTSRTLAQKRSTNVPLLHLPHGVENAHFALALRHPRPIQVMETIPRPIVGFFGLLSSWVDLGLIRFLSEQFPQVSFVLLGRAEVSLQPLADRPNVHCLGLVPYAELPWYARYFDVGLIPFVLNRLTRAVNPLKLLEYFALGLPVLSTRLPELEEQSGPLRLALTPEEFATGLWEQLTCSARCREQALRVAAENTWDRRVEQLSAFLEELINGCVAGAEEQSPGTTNRGLASSVPATPWR